MRALYDAVASRLEDETSDDALGGIGGLAAALWQNAPPVDASCEAALRRGLRRAAVVALDDQRSAGARRGAWAAVRSAVRARPGSAAHGVVKDAVADDDLARRIVEACPGLPDGLRAEALDAAAGLVPRPSGDGAR